MNDSELLERVKESDVEAFRALFERYQPLVFRHILYQTRDSDLAHDIVQETFLRIWERRGSLNPRLSFVSFLMLISTNLVRDNFKHIKVRRKLEAAIPPPTPSVGDNPEEALRLGVLERDIIKVVTHGLSERCRMVFLLSRVEGKSNKEIADLLGVTQKTVENQLHLALKVLRRKLRKYL